MLAGAAERFQVIVFDDAIAVPSMSGSTRQQSKSSLGGPVSPGLALRSLAFRYPRVGAPIVRACLHATPIVPRRARWIFDGLKRDLPCSWSRRVVRLSGGGRLWIDSRSAVGREVYFVGSYEPALCRILARWLEPGMTFIDAGANIGEFTVRAARIVGETGQVHALEASPETFELLVENVKLNRARNVRASWVALAGRDGPIDFYLSRGVASGSSSLRPAHDFSGRTLSMMATSLDTYISQAGIDRVDLLKIDIEGAELEALSGASKLLASSHAPVIVFEYHPVVATRFGVSRSDMDAFFKPLGYALSPLGPSASADSSNARAPENLLAIPSRLHHLARQASETPPEPSSGIDSPNRTFDRMS